MVLQLCCGVKTKKGESEMSSLKKRKPQVVFLNHLSTIIVVAEVPSIDMEAISARKLFGTSSRSEKRVIFHERIQSTVSLFFLTIKTRF